MLLTEKQSDAMTELINIAFARTWFSVSLDGPLDSELFLILS
jgi:hypothetical protein